MCARTLAILALLGCSLASMGQSPAPTVRTGRAIPLLESPATVQKAKASPAFRHGVRAPLDGFTNAAANAHSRDEWPLLKDWNVVSGGTWGDLTQHGYLLATALGRFYGDRYKPNWQTGFNVFLWADVDKRTRDTAAGLRDGFIKAGVENVKVDYLQGSDTDPLFHPFKAKCGTPNAVELKAIADDITNSWRSWVLGLHIEFDQFYKVLNLSGQTSSQLPLNQVKDHATAWSDKEERGSSPIRWSGQESYGGRPPYAGQFPYASSATEAFVLEYANRMSPVAWNRLPTATMTSILSLHEFYFEKTERNKYLARVEGSNLIREIRGIVNRNIGGCRHIPIDVQFAGLVGHDTNLANVGSRLNLTWHFADAPDDITKGLPANNALPAGALLFELWKRGDESVVTIWYSAQGLQRMRECTTDDCPGFVIPVQNPACQGLPNRCEIPLAEFNKLLSDAIDPNFLSACVNGQQICPKPPTARKRKKKGENQ